MVLRTIKQTEAEVTAAISGMLKRLGIWHFKHHGGCRHCGMYEHKGVSDIHAIYQKLPVWIEVKKSDWKPPKKGTTAYKHHVHQLRFVIEVRSAGGLAGFATSVNDAISILGVREIVAPKVTVVDRSDFNETIRKA